jgi:aspartokinase
MRQELGRMKNALLSRSSRDEFLALGENHSGLMLEEQLESLGAGSSYRDGRSAGVLMGERSVRVDESVVRISKMVAIDDNIPVIGGYVGLGPTGGFRLMGRNSTDVTMALAAAAFDAHHCENIKDTPVLRVQPTIEINGSPPIKVSTSYVPMLSYDESIHMGWRQSEVVHPKAVDIAGRSGRTILVKQLGNGDYTTICGRSATTREMPLAALSVRPCWVMSVKDPEMDSELFSGYIHAVTGAFEKIELGLMDMSGPSTVMSIVFPQTYNKRKVDPDGVKFGVEEYLSRQGFRPSDIAVRSRCAMSVVGDAMRDVPGMARRVLYPLERRGLSVKMITQHDEGESPPVLDFYVDLDRDAIEGAVCEFCDEFGFRPMVV